MLYWDALNKIVIFLITWSLPTKKEVGGGGGGGWGAPLFVLVVVALKA